MRRCMVIVAAMNCGLLAASVRSSDGAAAAPPEGAQVVVVTTFPSDSGPGPKDKPDNVGGVGPDHVVSFTCANFVVHDKKTGKVLMKKTQTEFWAELGFKDMDSAAQ